MIEEFLNVTINLDEHDAFSDKPRYTFLSFPIKIVISVIEKGVEHQVLDITLTDSSENKTIKENPQIKYVHAVDKKGYSVFLPYTPYSQSQFKDEVKKR